MLDVERQNIAELINKLLKTKSLLTSLSIALLYYIPQVNFPANNLNFTEGEGDGINSRLSS